jgi:hypothetical protein
LSEVSSNEFEILIQDIEKMNYVLCGVVEMRRKPNPAVSERYGDTLFGQKLGTGLRGIGGNKGHNPGSFPGLKAWPG